MAAKEKSRNNKVPKGDDMNPRTRLRPLHEPPRKKTGTRVKKKMKKVTKRVKVKKATKPVKVKKVTKRVQVRKMLSASADYSDVVQRADKIISKTRASRNLSALQVAKKLRLSIRTLQRAFKSVSGMSVHRYLQEHRLQFAHDQLVTTSDPIAVVGMNAGFNHASRFSAQYQRHYGELPSETRASRDAAQ